MDTQTQSEPNHMVYTACLSDWPTSIGKGNLLQPKAEPILLFKNPAYGITLNLSNCAGKSTITIKNRTKKYQYYHPFKTNQTKNWITWTSLITLGCILPNKLQINFEDHNLGCIYVQQKPSTFQKILDKWFQRWLT